MIGYGNANWFYRLMRWQAATAPMSWLWARTLHHLDRPVFRLTTGKHTFASLVTGLPVVMLTTTGARSGQRRALPVLGLPCGDGEIAVTASNYGQRRHPAWYHNLRKNPKASVSVQGISRKVVAREARGEERERLWRLGLSVYPGWAAYERRARDRVIPILVLSPATEKRGPASSRVS